MDQIRIESRLTDRQYRHYMNFHVLGNRRDVTIHVTISALIVIFGLINFRTGSPILGWIFVTLGAYFHQPVLPILHQRKPHHSRVWSERGAKVLLYHHFP